MKTQREEEQQQAEPEVTTEPKPETLTIPVGEDADDDGPEDAPETPETKKGRRQHFREMREALERQKTELAELRGRLSAPQPIIVPQAAPERREEDPAAVALSQIREHQRTTLRALSTPGLPEADQKRLEDQYHDLEQRRINVQTRIAMREIQQPEPRDETTVSRQLIEAKFPKIFERASLRTEAVAVAQSIQEQRRVPMSHAVAEEAAAIVYARHGLGTSKPPAPSEADKARHQSTPNRPGGSARQSFTPTRQQMTLAMAYTEHRKGLTDEQRLKAWYDEVGKPGGLV